MRLGGGCARDMIIRKIRELQGDVIKIVAVAVRPRGGASALACL